jgi:xyloglucan-specific exo-beta-1,4-glucanase
MLTSSRDPNNGSILRSVDYGRTWQKTQLPFKVGGNMPGRGMGERLVVDPNRGSVLFLGARGNNGLWKSTDYGATWNKVSSFTNTGTYAPNPAAGADSLDAAIVGISWIEFDPNSSYPGMPSKRIYVGVAEKNGDNVFVSEDAGATWKPLAGAPKGMIPHKGRLDKKNKLLYITYTDGAGPYDGAAGYVQRFNQTSKVWKEITPQKDNYGFGGFAIDAQNPNVIMTASLNQWWPDATIHRSLDSGETWSPIWTWGNYPDINERYNYDVSAAPWLFDPDIPAGDSNHKRVGWMIEGLEINPFDSNNFYYGTGATLFGSKDLTKWDQPDGKITLSSLANGIEETAVLGLAAPPTGPQLLSAVGDITGFTHNDVTKSPAKTWTLPTWPSSSSIDYAGKNSTTIVRVGTGGDTAQLAVSTNSGETWTVHPGAPTDKTGGKAAISADGSTIIWNNWQGTLVSVNNGPFTAPAEDLGWITTVGSDKVEPKTVYAAGAWSFLASKNGGPFTAATSSPQGTAATIAASPFTAGTVYVTTDNGLFKSTDFGKTFSQIPGPTKANGLAIGAKKDGKEGIFIAGWIDGKDGIFRSYDDGATWTDLSGKRGFGAIDSVPLAADLREVGKVYAGTNGRGIFVGGGC